MDMQFLYRLISMFMHHPIGVAPGFTPPVGYMPVG